MNLSYTPIRNFSIESNVLSFDNSPAFFTGCVDCIKIVSQISSLCSNCDSFPKISSPNYTVIGLQLNESPPITNEQNIDQNYNLHDNTLQEHLPKLSKVFSTPVQYKNQPGFRYRTKSSNLRFDQTKVKRVLLPSPPSVKMSELEYSNSHSKGIAAVTCNPYGNFEINSNVCEENQIATAFHSYTVKRKSSIPDCSPSLKKIIRPSENLCSDLPEIPNHTNHSYSTKRKSDVQDYSPPLKKRFGPSENPSSNLSEIQNYELSQMIWKLFSDHKQTDIVYKKKMALREQLHKILLRKFHNCGLYVVGSSMTGLGANSSDMDMCLMLTHSEIDQETQAAIILQDVRALFRQYEFLLNVEVIYAKVPILRFKDRVSEIEVDLNINNSVGIRNTQLLNSYARVDKRFPPLVLLTKLWARSHGINDAKNNTLSSYSLVLMVVHYLQYGCQPSVLPCLQSLQPHKFNPHSDVRILKLHEDLPDYESCNKEDLGTLFIGFLKYFSLFRFEDSVISVRLGGITTKETAMFSLSPRNKKGHWKFICIEEPFDLTNTARAVFKPPVFRYLKQVFVRSWHRLRKTADLDSILIGVKK